MEQANLFEFTDGHVGGDQVFYSNTSDLGPPQFIHVSSDGTRTVFTPDQIDTRTTALGIEVTVTLENVVNDHTKTLTVLIPVTMLATGDRVLVNTLGVVTTTTTTSAGPPPGVSQTHLALDLHGMAKQVVFPTGT
ncbi:hypothetical protein [Mycobacterium sp. OTB74]|jgi:hypothetical protein|uniref:hypothetical protein n=1 Tax=Mycobacterium sp. OTB74 TaxID=1853452 RepID=UPI00247676F3|nr:hypothetical protein [Mycobacterium sp. OTB74]MDH6243276.1 hypothetical protein [Mycobacterium sp. OTB74]